MRVFGVTRTVVVVVLCLLPELLVAFAPSTVPRLPVHSRAVGDGRPGLVVMMSDRVRLERERQRKEEDNRSLAQKMFGDVFGGVKKMMGAEDDSASEPDKPLRKATMDASDAITAADSKAKDGAITYDDFVLMGQTFKELDGKMDLPGQLSAKEIEETKAKFEKHEKIVRCMTEEERLDTELMRADLNDVENKCPRTQRLSLASGVSERDVALFIAEFEAMRQSTMRIAAGEDPDEVNKSIMEPSGNRQARRAGKKAQKQAQKGR